ncbi:MAG: type II toxin-antitoxin system HipA family toxin, partial [Rhodobacteraceae bacterium]|nr:type II toxin-antitoxin system HipA family toxin [Paracoccaceae bacterium]
QPALQAGQIEHRQMTMAMSVGRRRHYRFDQIHGRHFIETAQAAGLSRARAAAVVEGVAARAASTLDQVAGDLPPGFPPALVETVSAAVTRRVRALQPA